MTWTIADGTRGRRWRAMLVDDGCLVGALLLETDPAGRFRKLELATVAGLLTLHPEAATLHGNAVRPGGVEHLALPWNDDHLLLVVGTPVTAAAAARCLESRVGVGEGHSVAGISVDAGLAVHPATFRVVRPADRRWRFLPAAGGAETAVTLDQDWMPILDAGEAWPLELDPSE